MERIAGELRAHTAALGLSARERRAYPAACARMAFRVLCADLTLAVLGSAQATATDRGLRVRCMHAVLEPQRELAYAAAEA